MVVLQGGQQKRPELALRPINPTQGPMLKQVKEKTLNQVLRIFGRIPTIPDKGIQRVPVAFAKIGKSFLGTRRLALRRNQYHAPQSGLKLLRAAVRRTLVTLHLDVSCAVQRIESRYRLKKKPRSSVLDRPSCAAPVLGRKPFKASIVTKITSVFMEVGPDVTTGIQFFKHVARTSAYNK